MTNTSVGELARKAAMLKASIRSGENSIGIIKRDLEKRISEIGAAIARSESELADILQDLGPEIAKREGLITQVAEATPIDPVL